MCSLKRHSFKDLSTEVAENYPAVNIGMNRETGVISTKKPEALAIAHFLRD